MATSFDAFEPLIAADVAQCPGPVIIQQARFAAIEFCKRTKVWVADHAAINVLADTASYALIPPVANTIIVVPLNVFYDTKELKPKTREWLTERYGKWKDVAGEPSYFLCDNPRSLILVPKPTAALTAGLNLQVALKPTVTATDMDDDVYEDHFEDIVTGAKWRLFAMAGRPWSDKGLAEAHKTMFEDAIAKANLRAAKAFSRARLRSPAHFF